MDILKKTSNLSCAFLFLTSFYASGGSWDTLKSAVKSVAKSFAKEHQAFANTMADPYTILGGRQQPAAPPASAATWPEQVTTAIDNKPAHAVIRMLIKKKEDPYLSENERSFLSTVLPVLVKTRFSEPSISQIMSQANLLRTNNRKIRSP